MWYCLRLYSLSRSWPDQGALFSENVTFQHHTKSISNYSYIGKSALCQKLLDYFGDHGAVGFAFGAWDDTAHDAAEIGFSCGSG